MHNNHQSLIITTNKVVSQSDLSTIEKYIKNVDVIKTEDIITPHLPQSKFYLKIIDIPYIKKSANSSINFSDVEKIIQSIHIFNNVHLAPKLCIIKVSLKSDMVVVWINI